MSATFSFAVDPARNLVRLTLAGFFHSEDVAALGRARAEAYRELTGAPNTHATLIDVRELKIQSQETMTGFGALLADPAYRSRRVALLVSQTLARTQVERALASRPGVACFASQVEAEAWLDEADSGEAPSLRAAG